VQLHALQGREQLLGTLIHVGAANGTFGAGAAGSATNGKAIKGSGAVQAAAGVVSAGAAAGKAPGKGSRARKRKVSIANVADCMHCQEHCLERRVHIVSAHMSWYYWSITLQSLSPSVAHPSAHPNCFHVLLVSCAVGVLLVPSCCIGCNGRSTDEQARAEVRAVICRAGHTCYLQSRAHMLEWHFEWHSIRG
jgi:hypothetical protein